MVPESLEGGNLDYQYSSDVSPVEPRVAYITLRHGDGVFTKVHSWDIVTSGIDGTDYKRLTTEESLELNPVWSTDGMHIAFYSSRDGSYEAPFSLFVMDNDGSNVRNLTPGMKIVESELPVWSPGSDRIAFWVYVPSSQEGRSNDWVLHIVNSDGSGLRMISRSASHPAWSPDGRHLAFMMNDAFENAVETPTLVIAGLGDDSDVRHIPIQPRPEAPGEHVVDARALAWSQDGSKLKFVTCHRIPRDDDSWLENVRVYSLKAEGSAHPELIARWSVYRGCLGYGYELAWSPDRTRIAVSTGDSFDRSYGILFVFNVDGSGYRHLITVDDAGIPQAAYAERPQFADGIAACPQGFVVPSGALYEGLIKDCETLLSIANQLVKANVELNWGADEKTDNWDGVGIGADPPRVTRLSFYSGFGFAGSLPPGLAKLTALQTLTIESGSISGPLPTHLADLKSLRDLELTRVKLGGQIPPELASLTNLRSLILKGNGLSGPIPAELGYLTNLHHLDLSSNNLTGAIPPDLGNLTNLGFLSLRDNLLEGNIPHSLTEISGLYSVDLEHNNLSGCVPGDFLNNPLFWLDDEIEACEDN